MSEPAVPSLMLLLRADIRLLLFVSRLSELPRVRAVYKTWRPPPALALSDWNSLLFKAVRDLFYDFLVVPMRI